MTQPRSSLATYRARMERRGFVRVEVNVFKEDAGLVRRVAAALADPSRQAEARKLIRRQFLAPPKVSLKALLESAPLDGIDLERGRDHGATSTCELPDRYQRQLRGAKGAPLRCASIRLVCVHRR